MRSFCQGRCGSQPRVRFVSIHPLVSSNMKLLLTGACGFVGSTIAAELRSHSPEIEIVALDNLSRPGSERNRATLRELEIHFTHGDVRHPSDLDGLPGVDWVVDAAANPSVLAGLDQRSSSRQLLENNLFGTVNLLEYCKRHRAGIILLSTSRVYSANALANIPVKVEKDAFVPSSSELPWLTREGIAEDFSTEPPLSLYGASKLTAELLALEYGAAFNFPVWINRCGVLAGAGQFGKADQGIFSYWIHSYRGRKPLHYHGFDRSGHQVRDCLHPRDLLALFHKQFNAPVGQGTYNIGGGIANAMSLRQLTEWCSARWGSHLVEQGREQRRFDVPWLVLNCARARNVWDWQPATPLSAILEEIASHAEENPSWLNLSE